MSKLSLENKMRLEKLATPTIANVLDDLGFAGIMNGLQPAGLGMRVVGQAITVQEITGPYGSFSVEDFKVGHMIDAASTGEVIVVANNGAEVSTWGGMASYSAKLKGIGGLVVYYGTLLLIRLKVDDVVGAIPVHGFAGIWGTLAVPLTNSGANFGSQIYGILWINIFVFAVAFIVWYLMKISIGIRISEEAEKLGTDKAEVGVMAYSIRD